MTDCFTSFAMTERSVIARDVSPETISIYVVDCSACNDIKKLTL